MLVQSMEPDKGSAERTSEEDQTQRHFQVQPSGDRLPVE